MAPSRRSNLLTPSPFEPHKAHAIEALEHQQRWRSQKTHAIDGAGNAIIALDTGKRIGGGEISIALSHCLVRAMREDAREAENVDVDVCVCSIK